MDLSLSGLASGFDWKSVVDQIVEVERAPQRLLLSEQIGLNQVGSAYNTIESHLSNLNARVEALADTTLYDKRSSSSNDSDIATATADNGTAKGKYAFNIAQLATTSVQTGTSDVGAAINGTADVTGLVLDSANFATPITAGKFTVNGKQITLATTDSLQDVFDAINTATGGDVTGSYDPVTDKITLSGTGEIVLGSATDTSNFLAVTRLNNNGTGTVSSSYSLGSIQLSNALDSGNFTTAVSDGGAGNGEFTINGVSIAFSAADDSLADVIARINDSDAGVTASYDSVNDRLYLTNKVTGDLGVSMEDVTGNFLAATGLSSGTLSRGDNLEYTINSGGTLVSQSNTITADSSGLSGVTVTALDTGTVNIEIKNDTDTIRTAITNFIQSYNTLQSYIDNATSSTTDSDGKVSAGILASESDASTLSTALRRIAHGQVTGLSTSFDKLGDLGIISSGDNNQMSLSDAEALDTALANSIPDIKSLFTDATNGIATQLETFIDGAIGDDGSIIERQATITKQSNDIDSQIEAMERLVQANRQSMINGFVAMEQAQAKSNQQLQFLASQIGSQ